MRLFYRCCIIFAIQPGLIATLNLFALPYSDWEVRDPRRKPESRWRTPASHGPRLSPGVTHLTSRYVGRSGPSLLSPPSAPPHISPSSSPQPRPPSPPPPAHPPRTPR